MDSLRELNIRVDDLESRVSVLEGSTVEPPVEPPIEPPVEPPVYYDHELDMSVSNHIDVDVDAGETVVFRFVFEKTNGQSYSHFTVVPMATGPCFKMTMDQYGYSQDNCQEETSEGVGTDGEFTDWIVERNKYLYLQVHNELGAGRLRLKWMKETGYN